MQNRDLSPGPVVNIPAAGRPALKLVEPQRGTAGRAWLGAPVVQSLRPGEHLAAGTGFCSTLEALRFFSALGIIWYYLQAPGAPIAYSALALFLIMSAFFAVGSVLRNGARQFWTGRARRILLPWLAWCAFYLMVDRLRTGTLWTFPQLDSPLALLIGPSLHLWFLPFLFLASAPIVFVARQVRSGRATLWLAAGAVLVALVSLHFHTLRSLPPPLAQWSMAIPPVCYGLIAAHCRRWNIPLVPAGFLGLLSAASFAFGAMDGLLQLVIAAAAFELAWRIPLPPLGQRIAVALGRVSFGIYLIHPFFVLVYFKLFPGSAQPVAAVLFVFVLSALATAVLQCLPGLRRLV